MILSRDLGEQARAKAIGQRMGRLALESGRRK
jgi:hypothetical protein